MSCRATAVAARPGLEIVGFDRLTPQQDASLARWSEAGLAVDASYFVDVVRIQAERAGIAVADSPALLGKTLVKKLKVGKQRMPLTGGEEIEKSPGCVFPRPFNRSSEPLSPKPAHSFPVAASSASRRPSSVPANTRPGHSPAYPAPSE